MADSRTITINLKAVSDFNDVVSNAKQIQTVLNKLKLPESLKGNFEKIFGDIEKYGNKAAESVAKGFKTKGDLSGFEKSVNSVSHAWEQLLKNLNRIDDNILKDSFNIDASKLKEAQNVIKNIQNQLNKEFNNDSVEQLGDSLAELKNKYKKVNSATDEFMDALKRGDLEEAQKKIDAFTNSTKKMAEGPRKRQYESFIAQMNNTLKSLDINKIKELQEELKKAEIASENLGAEEFQKFVQSFANFGATVKEGEKDLSKFGDEALKSSQNVQHINSEMDHFKQRIAYFFGATNAVNLFKRALQSAFATVKDLDAVMTETAVVTKFDVGQMWAQLPEYTKRANELGVTIHDTYEAATIYYQQGLETNQVMEVSNQTLKMARIAGLDAAEATDRMTNALRGFNMEINEMNAERVADVYSKLAAMSASNVDEISTAMTKVASLASNANMEFETTAAFLAQMIETTRESAETAGTALKTVIARFSEVKSLYSKGELLGTDEEGEAIDVNKVSKALRSVGVNLNEYLTGMKGLDDIFIELASKWDSLDRIQQRYIATMAAGSRQQSRFIAMMQDYARTQELVSAAATASGAAQAQYQKTLESLETKLNRLKNAWAEFVMSIANNAVIKGVVDIITSLISAINKLTSVLPGPLSGLAKLGVAFGAFKLGKKLLSNFLPTFINNFKDIGAQSGQSFLGALIKSVNERKSIFKNKFDLAGIFKGSFKKLPLIDPKQANFQSVIDGLDTIEQKREALAKTDSQFQFMNTYDPAALDAYIADLEQTDISTLKAAESQKKFDQRMAATSAACVAAGSALLLVGDAMEKAGADTKAVDMVKTLGTALISVGGLIPVVAALFKTLGIGIAKDGQIAQAGWGWIGLVLGIVALLITVTVTLIKNSESAAQKYERLTNEAKKAADASKEVANQYDELKDALTELSNQENTLKKLTVGTNEWANAVVNLNQKVLDLVEKFPQLAQFITSNNGILGFTEEGIAEVEEAYRKQVYQAQVVSAATNLEAHQQERGAIRDRYDSILIGAMASSGASGGLLPEEKRIAEQVSRALNGNKESIDALDAQLKALGTSYDEVIESNRGNKEGADFVNSIFEALGQSQLQLITDENYEAFMGLGSGLNTSELIDPGLYKSVMAPILSEMTGQFEDEVIDVFSGILDPDKINEIIETKAEEINFTAIMGDYKAFFKRLYGNDITFTNSGGIKQDGKEILSAESAKKQYVAGNLDTYGIQEAESFYNNIITQTEDNLELQQAILEFYKNGQESLSKVNADYILKNLGTVQGLLGPEVANKIGSVAESSKQFFENFRQDFNKNAGYNLNATSEFNRLGSELLQNVSTDEIESYFNNLSSIYAKYGVDSAQKFSDSFYDILSGLSIQEKKKVFELAKNFDFTKYVDIKDFSKELKALGYNIPDSEIEALTKDFVSLAGITREFNLSSLSQQFSDILSLSDEIQDKDEMQGLTQEEYDKLIGVLPDLEEAFIFDGQNYLYVEGTMADLAYAVRENTAAILGNTAKQLEETIALGEETKALIDDKKLSEKYAGVSTEDLLAGVVSNPDAIRAFMDAIFGAGYSNKFDNDRLFDDYQTKMAAYNDLDQNRAMLNDHNNKSAASTVYQKMINTNSQDITSGEYALTGMNPDALEQYDTLLNKVISSSSDLQEKSKQLSAELQSVGVSEEAAERQGKELAIQYDKLERGIDEVRKAIGDELDVINDSTASAGALSDSYQNIAKVASKVFGSGLTADFVAQHIEDFKQLEQGIPEAYDNICRHLNEANAATWADICTNTEQGALTVTNIMNALDGISFNAYGYADFSDIERAAQSAGINVMDFIHILEQANGITVSYDPGAMDMIATGYSLMSSGSVGNLLAGAALLGAGKAILTAGSFSVSKGSPSFNPSGHGGYTPKGGSGGGGGGGGKEEKPTYWKNPYDELYNLTEKINEALRTREALERRYQKIAKLGVTTAGEMRKAFTAQIDQLKREIELQKQLEQGRLRQIKNVGNQIYTDKEGNRSTFSQLGVTRYANYNEKTGLIQIDWNAIEVVSRDPNRSEEGEAIEAYISKLEELVEGYEEIRDTIWDMEDEIEELVQQSIDDYLDFESRVYDAMVAAREKEIEAYGALSDAIQDSTSRVLNKMQEQIEDERQARENDKTEEEIADREARLAYLSRDTSGANQLEIMKLQQELDDARQSYTDSLIDQAIQEMQKDADKAAEQREQQQALLEAQLKFDEEQGIIMAQVEEILRNSFSDDQAIAMNDEELKKLLQDNEAFKNMSSIGKEEWLRGFIESWNKAQSGYKADEEKKKAEAAAAAAQSTTSSTPTTTTPKQPAASTPKYPLPLSDDTAKGIATSICFVSGGGGWGNWPDRENRLVAKFGNGAYWKVQQYVEQIVAAGWSNLWGKDGRKYTYASFKTGGLADFTGPAWLDGSRSHPEMVLNAADTENLIMLKDILNSILKRTSNAFGTAASELNFDIDINADLSSDYDVEQLADKVKGIIYDEAMYKNVNTVNRLR